MQIDRGHAPTSKAQFNDDDSKSTLEMAQTIIREELSSTPDQLSTECIAALELLINAISKAGPSQLQIPISNLLEDSGLRYISDGIVLLVLSSVLSSTSSYSQCADVARHILLPAIAILDAPPTQSLLRAAQHVGDIHPQALIEHCLQPLIVTMPSSSNSTDAVLVDGSLRKHQAEFIISCVKQGMVPESMVHEILEAVCKAPAAWNEHVIALVQGVLDVRPRLPAPTIIAIASGFLSAGHGELKGSIKAAKTLLFFVKTYGGQLEKEGIEYCSAAAQSIGTFMAKTILATLNKL